MADRSRRAVVYTVGFLQQPLGPVNKTIQFGIVDFL